LTWQSVPSAALGEPLRSTPLHSSVNDRDVRASRGTPTSTTASTASTDRTSVLDFVIVRPSEMTRPSIYM
jgi:hypothetical protein